MKKYLRLSCLTLILIFSFSALPKLAAAGTAEISLQYPQATYLNDYIYASGVVEEQQKKEIFADVPIVPLRVNFIIGDEVKAGDVIATVDVNATKLAILNMAEAVSQIPKEYIEAMGNISFQTDYIGSIVPTEIVAEKTGKITGLTMVEGAISYPKLPLAAISDTSDLRINLNVSELDCDRVKEGDSVFFKAAATKDEVYEGEVWRIFPTAQTTLMGSEKQTVVGLYVKPLKNYPSLKPGYTVNGVIKKGEGEICLTVPYEAIGQDEENREYVYINENGKAKKILVKTGKEFKNTVEITEGITGDAPIIKNASDIKRDGQRVRVSR